MTDNVNKYSGQMKNDKKTYKGRQNTTEKTRLNNMCLLTYDCCHWRRSSTLFYFVTYVLDLAIYNPLSPSISAIRSHLQVFLGFPLPCFPCGFHCRACLVMLCFGFLSVCPIHLQRKMTKRHTTQKTKDCATFIPLKTIFLLDFWNVSTVCYFVYHFLIQLVKCGLLIVKNYILI